MQQSIDLVEGDDLIDVRVREFLCPVCRRLGTTLLPALAPMPLSSPTLPNQAMKPSPVLPSQAIQQQAGPAAAQVDTKLMQQHEEEVEYSGRVLTPSPPPSRWPDQDSLQPQASGKICGILCTLETMYCSQCIHSGDRQVRIAAGGPSILVHTIPCRDKSTVYFIRCHMGNSVLASTLRLSSMQYLYVVKTRHLQKTSFQCCLQR